MNYVNLARINPNYLKTKSFNPGQPSSLHVYYKDGPIKCVTVGFLAQDVTREAQEVGSTGKYQKFVDLVPLVLEADRMFTAICLLFGVDRFVGDLIDNKLRFSTRMLPKNGGGLLLLTTLLLAHFLCHLGQSLSTPGKKAPPSSRAVASSSTTNSVTALNPWDTSMLSVTSSMWLLIYISSNLRCSGLFV